MTINFRIPLAASAAAAAAAAPVLGSVGYQAYASRRDLSRYPLPGTLANVGGYRLHVHTEGLEQPGPAVLFEAGLGCPLDTWGWIQPEIARIAPTISYDRAGIGGSDRGPRPRSGQQILNELDQVLAQVGVPGPYVLVGHSFGGLLVRAFAARHPDAAAALVLADSTHPDQLRRSRRQRRGTPEMRAQMKQAATSAALGFNRWSRTPMVKGIKELPDPRRAQARMLTVKATRTACDELDGWLSHVADEVRDLPVPVGCRLAVVTAGQVAEADPVHAQLQGELAALSPDSIRRSVPHADHLGLVMNEVYAVHVRQAIEDLLTAIRSHQPASPLPAL
jgi:pimeloyl-ACP methyl ester carboxylesterase